MVTPAALPADLATQIKYGAETGTAVRRSQYLADALKQLGEEGSKNIQSPGELVAKLLATAVLNRAGKSADRSALQSILNQQNNESDTMLAGLRPPAPATPLPTLGPAPSAPPPSAAPAPQPEPAPPPPQIAPTASNYTPQDHDALTRMLATEAIGEGPDGMAAAGHVALNRLKNGYGGAKSLSDVINQPHQFEGMSRANQVSPQDYAAAGQVADQVLAGQAPDPTNGAMAFLNPDLQVKLGRRVPAWAAGGDGHRIGNHVFFGAQGPQLAQNTAQPPGNLPPPPPPPDPNGPDIQNVPQISAGANPFPPSAPGSVTPGAGAAPAGVSPQAVPAGASAAQGITPEQIGLVEKLLKNPRTHEVGMAYAMELQKKAAEPTKFQTQLVNGMPAWLDPEHPGVMQTAPIPDQAQTHVLTGDDAARFNVPPGTVVMRSPNGDLKFEKPATGQMVTSQPGQPYAEKPIPGGSNDATVPQRPQQGYQYGPGGQAPIAGGPADPKAPMNVVAGTEKIQGAIQPILDKVTKARQSAGAVAEGFHLQNGTGDIAMVNGLQHLIDDGVVRGEDVNMQMKSSGITGTLGQWAQYVNSGGLLTPEIRTKVNQASQGLFSRIDQQYKAQVLAHRPTVDALYGDGAFDQFVLPKSYQTQLGWADNTGAPAAPPPPTPMHQPVLKPGTREAAIAEAKRRGLIH